MTILSERRLTLSQAARTLDVNPSTTWRWALNGVRGVRLETFNVGAKRYTTEVAIERFVNATTAAAATGPMPSARTPRQREQAIKNAEDSLAKEGM